MKLTALLIGKSDCIASALRNSSNLLKLYVISDFANPGLADKADELIIGNTNDPIEVAKHAERLQPDFAVIGSEEPLEKGVVDKLAELGIPCVGPFQKLAQLESSKAFTRQLIAKYGISGNPEFRVFRNGEAGLAEYLAERGEFVVKPDGLTGGKGVKVFGEHLATISEGVEYCQELFDLGHRTVVIEEKLDGEEFSFQSFFDGRHIAHMIPIQDHKRAFDNDTGPNTGGMGSYSCADHLLPFLTKEHVQEAGEINRLVGEALLKETGQEYKGVLYGGFMLTKNGLRVIEYNARFGDPEVMNVMSLLETDFVDICQAIIRGTLNQLPIKFKHQASVCKYIVPEGYPKKSASAVGREIDLSRVLRSPDLGSKLRLFYGAVNEEAGAIRLTDSRSLALVGVADTLQEAEKISEKAASSVRGPVHHRQDIGTSKLIQKRIDHMEQIAGTGVRRRA
ncbi:MAG: phosphoribosylamine--glycine ligase [Rhizomicrobium sp.]